jgi:hypothetical protein
MSITSFRIIDSTLREGEQFALAHFTIEQKLAAFACSPTSAAISTTRDLRSTPGWMASMSSSPPPPGSGLSRTA